MSAGAALQKWGENTKVRSLYLSISAWDVIDQVCAETELSRGELLLAGFMATYGREDEISCPGSLKKEEKRVVNEEGEWTKPVPDKDDWLDWTPSLTKFDENGTQIVPDSCKLEDEVQIITAEGTEATAKAGQFDWSEVPGAPGMKLSKRKGMRIIKYKKIT